MKPGNPKKAWWFLILTLILLMIIAAIGVWSKQAREPTEARMAAQKFIDFLYTDDFRSAYELTAKSGYVGKTEAEFVVIARREQCPSKPVFISTFPFQSNGNWLRRWVNNKDQGMDRINIEFRGEKEVCLLGVTIQKMQNQSWRVTRFGRHAG